MPKKRNPRDSTRTVFMWPKTWKDTAENRPMQMNWLRLTPMAMKHERVRKNCRIRVQYCTDDIQIKTPDATKDGT